MDKKGIHSDWCRIKYEIGIGYGIKLAYYPQYKTPNEYLREESRNSDEFTWVNGYVRDNRNDFKWIPTSSHVQ